MDFNSATLSLFDLFLMTLTVIFAIAFTWTFMRNRQLQSSCLMNQKILADIRQQSERNLFFINALPGIVSIFNENLQYEECNDLLLEKLQMRREDLIGKPLGFIHHNATFATRIEEFHLSDHKIERFEMEDQNDFSTETKFYHCILYKSFPETGMQICAISIDLTDLKQKEQALEIKRIELIESEKLITLGELASGLSHEVNNPMAIISGRVQVLLRKIETNELDLANFKLNLQKIVETTQRVKRIVQSLKIISKDSNDINIRDFTVQDVLDPLMALYGHRLFFHGIDYSMENKYPDVIVRCSLAELSQVVLHLIKNSIDAIKDHAEKWMRIEVIKLEDKIQILFVDSGQGIPEAVQEKMFQPFFTTKTNVHGTGVGLAAARDLIRRQNGDLFYKKDHPNTCFVLELEINQSGKINS